MGTILRFNVYFYAFGNAHSFRQGCLLWCSYRIFVLSKWRVATPLSGVKEDGRGRGRGMEGEGMKKVGKERERLEEGRK